RRVSSPINWLREPLLSTRDTELGATPTTRATSWTVTRARGFALTFSGELLLSSVINPASCYPAKTAPLYTRLSFLPASPRSASFPPFCFFSSPFPGWRGRGEAKLSLGFAGVRGTGSMHLRVHAPNRWAIEVEMHVGMICQQRHWHRTIRDSLRDHERGQPHP